VVEFRIIVGDDGSFNTNIENNAWSRSDVTLGVQYENDPVTLVKKTNGVISRTAPGATLDAGSTVTWTYEITNTGLYPLYNTKLVDDKQGTWLLTDSSGNLIGNAKSSLTTGPGDTIPEALEPGETWTVTVTGPAVVGQYVNNAIFTGDARVTVANQTTSISQSAEDISHYNGVAVGTPAITLTKIPSKNNFNAGDVIEYKFNVLNSGNVKLINIAITDPKLGIRDGDCNLTLDPGKSGECAVKGTRTMTQDDVNMGEYKNTATVTGVDPNGNNVTDDDSVTIYSTPKVTENTPSLSNSATPSTQNNKSPIKKEKKMKPNKLPHTGGPQSGFLWFGLLLLVAGFVLMIRHRNR